GPVGVYEKKALLLVHYGGGTRDQLLALAYDIKESIHSAFGFDLEIEPQLFTR
ncbi:UDP-N-acetylmuramate dehydrogenase, partial [Neptunomonas phycophila]|nr:UDP-N-acetylmuramate dehydrogenase [Neptunomonas phycophila]